MMQCTAGWSGNYCPAKQCAYSIDRGAVGTVCAHALGRAITSAGTIFARIRLSTPLAQVKQKTSGRSPLVFCSQTLE